MGAFYEFVKAHLTVVNNVMASSAALVALMDFFAPRLSLLPKLVYSATGLALLLMLFAAIAPATLARAFGAMGWSSSSGAAPALWRRPAWQFAVAILLGVTTLGFVSVAKASQGGIIAGSLPDARRWQESILSLQADSAAIRSGVDSANAKLDALVEGSNDPQKDVVARGYSFDHSGLAKAIRQGDLVAVELFAKARLRVAGKTPIANLLNGDQRWSPEIAAALAPEMFENPRACDDNGLLRYELKPPADQRVAVYRRLCGSDPRIARLKAEVEAERAAPPASPFEEQQREARKSNLALLSR
jgi:hypothetical protein